MHWIKVSKVLYHALLSNSGVYRGHTILILMLFPFLNRNLMCTKHIDSLTYYSPFLQHTAEFRYRFFTPPSNKAWSILSFYKVPNSKTEPTSREKWIWAISRQVEGKTVGGISHYAYLCSRHFVTVESNKLPNCQFFNCVAVSIAKAFWQYSLLAILWGHFSKMWGGKGEGHWGSPTILSFSCYLFVSMQHRLQKTVLWHLFSASV